MIKYHMDQKERKETERVILIVMGSVKTALTPSTLIQRCMKINKELDSTLIKIITLKLVSDGILDLDKKWCVKKHEEKFDINKKL